MTYTLEKVQVQIIDEIQQSLKRCMEQGLLDLPELPVIELETPREKQFGDFSTNIAMQLPKITKKAPRFIAETIVGQFDKSNTKVASVTIAGPGFINFTLEEDWIYGILQDVKHLGAGYGKTKLGAGKKANVEFISANPTGPMHMGNARGGAIGDGMSQVLSWAGYEVVKEFYINDAGNQIEKFGQSLEARYLQINGVEVEFPEDGYKGEDITIHMNEFTKKHKDKYVDYDSRERREVLIAYALEKNINKIKQDLKSYGIEYDVWFHESSLHEENAVLAVVEELTQRGHTYEKDGATWFKATEFGCDKDDVLIRNNDIPTYFAADIAYHVNKLRARKFDWAINVWGADHHGHVARVKAALDAIGLSGDQLDVILMQLVRLVRKGETARMSKRQGNMVTLSDLIEEVGRDAARFFFNLRAPESHFDFDLDLAVEQSNENPVFYVQYAHARICSILRQMEEDLSKVELDYTLLKEKEERELIRILAELPVEIDAAVEKMDPSKITRYAMDVASGFHTFYNACRVRTDDMPLMKARVELVRSVQRVLKNVTTILGIEAPERM
ncbi:arginine--tRNA ligase [Alkalibacter rhizosphaerae]|uniref:Arginine--tRNA ligase n=1 Tax=Alkalibacter rhizosphaerae TaxID=2815577 RepID=A0A975AHL8_9FIRM|nr:arginine--tRNA ligase [Alkalibacter rhizosphaerae]QSX08153.1 arginine--tRNA ligase [Alkalibacter rhizosphaerae]